MSPQQLVDHWNQNHPIGTAVKITNEAGVATLTTTKSVAMLFAKSEPVVYTRCMAGFINLNKLTVVKMTIKEIIADIIAKEKGYVNHPADHGGPTNYGITRWSYAEYFNRNAADITIAEIKAVTTDLAERIYLKLYYLKPNIANLPELIQPIMLDMAVNHGRRGSVKILQKALVVNGYTFAAPDGIIGEKTIANSRLAVANQGKNFITSLIDCRINYYAEIIKEDPTQAVFRNGWIARAESFRPTATA